MFLCSTGREGVSSEGAGRLFTTAQRPPSITLLSSVLSAIHLAALRLPALLRGFGRTDPEELRYPATIFVWVRWFLLAACVIELVYRPLYTPFTYSAYILCLTFLTGFNGYVHYRVRGGGTVTLRWLLALSAMDVVVITAAMVVAGGFSHFLFYLLYYPALAWFAVFFSSFKLSFAWVTMVAVLDAAVSLTAGEGLDFGARDEKALFARIAVMYAVVASVNLVSRSERIKKQEAVERERELQRQRIELSQTIHDTTAQWAYMIGLGIEGAMELVDESQEALKAKLRLAADLSRSAMWELRHPIDGGQIFRGEALGEVLDAHAATFTVITSVPAEFVQHGTEPDLSTITRSLLFSIAHNALTNVVRHAQAQRVTIDLDCGADRLRLSVSDGGTGLPPDYEARGHGFRNMRADAERMGGRLEVESGGTEGGSGGGTTVSCVIPYPTLKGGE